jgi:hypothetical protein
LLEGTTNSQSEYNGMHTNDNLLKIREYRTWLNYLQKRIRSNQLTHCI